MLSVTIRNRHEDGKVTPTTKTRPRRGLCALQDIAQEHIDVVASDRCPAKAAACSHQAVVSAGLFRRADSVRSTMRFGDDFTYLEMRAPRVDQKFAYACKETGFNGRRRGSSVVHCKLH